MISVEQQWQFFLEKVKLSETKMHPMQTVLMKQAFYAAWGQLLILQQDEPEKVLPQKPCMHMIQQVNKFWKKQI